MYLTQWFIGLVGAPLALFITYVVIMTVTDIKENMK